MLFRFPFLKNNQRIIRFSFIYNESERYIYSLNNGHNAKPPILLFMYLLLKYLCNLSKEGAVKMKSDRIYICGIKIQFVIKIDWIFLYVPSV